MDEFSASHNASISGLKAQAQRLRTISENLANADTTAKHPGGQPYRRKVVTFANELDRATGADKVKVAGVVKDMSDFDRKYDPNHPAADAGGYVLKPNVNMLIELMDMKEAQRSYEANLNAYSAVKDMKSRTLNLLQ